MRAIRRILLALAVLVGIAVAADFALRAFAESQVSSAIQADLQLSRQPDVSLGGFPFLPRAVAGHLDVVTADAGDVTVEGGLSFRRVDVTLRDVAFSATGLMFGRSSTIRARRGVGTARLTGEDIAAAIQRTGTDIDVRLADGLVHLSGAGLPGELTASVSVEGTTLHLHPDNVPIPLDIIVDLGELVPGVRYTRIRIEGSEAVVSLALRRLAFEI
jgi:LmeA-like phospholipid-binding